MKKNVKNVKGGVRTCIHPDKQNSLCGHSILRPHHVHTGWSSFITSQFNYLQSRQWNRFCVCHSRVRWVGRRGIQTTEVIEGLTCLQQSRRTGLSENRRRGSRTRCLGQGRGVRVKDEVSSFTQPCMLVLHHRQCWQRAKPQVLPWVKWPRVCCFNRWQQAKHGPRLCYASAKFTRFIYLRQRTNASCQFACIFLCFSHRIVCIILLPRTSVGENSNC